jgi:hypothetical protein
VGTRKVGKAALVKILNYYKVNSNNRNRLMLSYNRYLNAINSSSKKNAHNAAENAATQFVTALFQMYEKRARKAPNAVSRGIHNGVRKTILWWLPGVIYRGTIKNITGPRVQTNLN